MRFLLGRVAAAQSCESVPASRLFDGFFHLADFLLDFPAYLFANTFAFQVGIVRQFAHLFLNGALHFVNPACDLILSTWLHLYCLLRRNSNSGIRLSTLRLHRATKAHAPNISQSASPFKGQ